MFEGKGIPDIYIETIYSAKNKKETQGRWKNTQRAITNIRNARTALARVQYNEQSNFQLPVITHHQTGPGLLCWTERPYPWSASPGLLCLSSSPQNRWWIRSAPRQRKALWQGLPNTLLLHNPKKTIIHSKLLGISCLCSTWWWSILY